MRKFLLGTIAVTLALSGCANMTETQRGTATGAGVGAGVGAVIGAATGGGGSQRTATGAVLGGLAGAVAGNIWSKKMEAQKQAMEQATQGTDIKVSRTADNRLKLDIPSDASFATDRADINANFRKILDKFAEGLVDNTATQISIIGHTDNTGSDAINNPLSIERAARTRDYLTAKNVASRRISVDGRGPHEPLAANDTAAGRAQNRRVEIFVTEPQR